MICGDGSGFPVAAEGSEAIAEAYPALGRNHETMPGRFSELVARMPPQAIHVDAEYRSALEMIAAVLSRPKLTKGQADDVETWAALVEACEREHHGIDTAASPVEALHYLLKESGMTASDLGRLLGNRTLGSAILSGQRALPTPRSARVDPRRASVAGSGTAMNWSVEPVIWKVPV